MNTEKKSPPDYLTSWLKQKLRRISYQWIPRKLALKQARKARGKYECAHCKHIFGPKEIQADHIDSVIPLTGWDDWNGFILRLFCDVTGYQILCKPCHQDKSTHENSQRTNVHIPSKPILDFKKKVKRINKTPKRRKGNYVQKN